MGNDDWVSSQIKIYFNNLRLGNSVEEKPLDLFVDSGIVFGYAYANPDKERFFYDSRALFEGRNFRNNNYYTTKGIVEFEVENVRRKRLKNESMRIIRLFPLRAEAALNKIIDVSFHSHLKYRELTDTLEAFLLSVSDDDGKKKRQKKQHDAILLSNSHIWASTNSGLNSPYFLTTDGKDIFRNRFGISQRAIICLASPCPLRIDFISDFIQRGLAS